VFATLSSEGFERRISGVRVFERGREYIGRWSENISSLPCLRGLQGRDRLAAFAAAHEPRSIREGELRYLGF
jgi:hypothetical protein